MTNLGGAERQAVAKLELQRVHRNRESGTGVPSASPCSAPGPLDGHDSLSIDLDGNRRAIKRIVVYGNELGHGWSRWRTAGTFSVTAS